MKAKILFSLALIFGLQQTQAPEGWEAFEKITYEWKYFEVLKEEILAPVFDEGLKALEGKEIILSGYYLPFEIDSSFILSAMPYASCFFCGSGGAESVAQIRIQPVPDDFEPDQFVKVKGKLKLNDSDFNYMNLILEDSELIKD